MKILVFCLVASILVCNLKASTISSFINLQCVATNKMSPTAMALIVCNLESAETNYNKNFTSKIITNSNASTTLASSTTSSTITITASKTTLPSGSLVYALKGNTYGVRKIQNV